MTDAVIRDVLEPSTDELPDQLRIVLVVCVVDGITPEQCSELFALTSETVESRLHNAQNLLVGSAYTPVRSRLRWRL
jgi:DNA-directed RNA polymerase specialized sigma24 family protein